jgi:hypothetical protein
VAGDGRRGLSKLNSMRGLELGGMPREAAIRDGRPREREDDDGRLRGRPREAARQLARPGSVDMLGRTIGGRPGLVRSRPKWRTGAGGAVSYGHRFGAP